MKRMLHAHIVQSEFNFPKLAQKRGKLEKGPANAHCNWNSLRIKSVLNVKSHRAHTE